MIQGLLTADWILVAPVALALGGAALCALFWWRPIVQTWVGLVTTTLMVLTSGSLLHQVLAGGTQVMAMGNWPAPFGIVFVADVLGAGLAFITALLGLATLVFSLGDQGPDFRRVGYTPLLLAMLGGVSGAFLTGDIFNLYVWFEVLLIGSFGLIVLGGHKEQLDGALKYAVLNLLATTFFLIATGLLYGLTGTLNFADLNAKVAAVENQGLVTAVASLYLLAFGMKAAAFPLFFWLPASYHTPQPGVSAIFGGLLTKVGVYALFRTFTLVFPLDGGVFNDAFLWIAGLTILFGGMGAMAFTDIRRVVAFTVVSGIGYMLVALALFTPAAFVGGLFYMVHSMLISTALFMATGIAGRIGGGYDTQSLAGVYRAAPAFSAIFLLGVFIAAGIPPLSGFWPKVVLVTAALDAGASWLAAAILLGGFLTLLALSRAFALAFWRDADEALPPAEISRGAMVAMIIPTFGIMLLATFIGVFAEHLMQLAAMATGGLLDPAGYIEAVMGGAE